MPHLGAKTARRLYDELDVCSAGGPQGRRRGAEDPRAEGARAEGRGEHPRLARAVRRPGVPRRPAAALQGAPDRRGAGGVAARAPGGDRGRGGGIGAALGRDLQGHRPDRHRRGAGAALAPPRRAPADRRRRHPGAERAPRPDPQRRLGRPADRRPARPSATCCSTSPARRPTTSPSARPRSPAGLSVSEHGITETESGEVTLCAQRGRGLRATRLRLHRAGAARGPGGAERGARGLAARAGRGRPTSAVSCTATRPSQTGATPWRRWRRPGAPGATPTWRSPTTRPATGSAITSPRSASGSGSARSGSGTRAGAASASWPAPRSTSAPTAPSTTPTTSWRRSTG